MQQFRHGCHSLFILLFGHGIYVFRLTVTVFLCMEYFDIMTELARSVGILFVQLLATHIEGCFRLLPIVAVLTYFQPLVIAVENRDVYRQGEIRISEPIMGLARGVKEMMEFLLISYCSELSAQRDGGNVSGAYSLNLAVCQLLTGREQPQFGKGFADTFCLKQDYFGRHRADCHRRFGRKVEQEAEQVQLLFVKRRILVALRYEAFQIDLHTG